MEMIAAKSFGTIKYWDPDFFRLSAFNNTRDILANKTKTATHIKVLSGTP